MDKPFNKTRCAGVKLSALLVAMLFMTVVAGKYLDMGENNHPGIIRFHVIANSDSKEDQDLKLKVRDEVIFNLQNNIENTVQKVYRKQRISDKERETVTRIYILSNLDKINSWAEGVIKKEGYGYNVTTKMGITEIPAKTYDGITFPKGAYEALNIRIGKAKGQNWWCVIFPPLCLIDGQGKFLPPQEKGLMPYKEKRIILKSKIKELLKCKEPHQPEKAS